MQGITVAGIITTFLIDIMAGSVHEHAISHFIDNLRKGGKPVNHDLQKAVRLSFFSALQEIIRGCHKALMRGAERKFPMLPADYPEEHQAELEWLDDKHKELAKEMKEIQKKNFTEGLFETIGEIESLLNPKGLTAEKRILTAKEKLIDKALNDDIGSICYENTVREKLFKLVHDYFVQEIKHTPNVRHIFDAQLIAQINATLTDLQKEQQQNKWLLSQIKDRLTITEDLSEPSTVVNIYFNKELDQFSTPELFLLIEEAQQIVKMRMLRVEPGSIVLVFEGSFQECEQIQKMFNEGKLKDIAGIPVINVSIGAVKLFESGYSVIREDGIIEKAKICLSSLLWIPEGAGEPLVALDISEQKETFQTDKGEITITCIWEGEIREHSPYIWLKWKADIKPDAEFVIQFLNPATKEVRYEVCPGKFMQGNTTLKKEKLGFDPTKDKWGIYIAVKAKE